MINSSTLYEQPIPPSTFVSLLRTNDRIEASVMIQYNFANIEVHVLNEEDSTRGSVEEIVIEWLENLWEDRNLKVVATSFDPSLWKGQVDFENRLKLCERVWLDLDIVPVIDLVCVSKDARDHVKEMVKTYFELPGRIGIMTLSESSAGDVPHHGFDIARVRFGDQRKMIPQFLTTLDAYRNPMYAGATANEKEFDRFISEVNRFKRLNNKILFLNSTAQGGGVALMRHALIRLYGMVGCDVEWHVLSPSHKIFSITKKKFHNMLQGIAKPDICLNALDAKIFQEWSESNVTDLKDSILNAKVIVCDDYQPSGLIPFIKNWNPEAKIIYRSHIHIDSALIEHSGSAQSITWNFIWKHNQVEKVDVFLSHPIKEFVPNMVPQNKIVLMPASTDPLDGLNKPLKNWQIQYYLLLFNNFLINDGQSPLDLNRPYIIQTARFDPSKGIPNVMESYRRFRKLTSDNCPLEKIPQLVIVGHGSIDDPEGVPMVNAVEAMLMMDSYDPIRNDIKRARLPHNDQILNALLRASHVAMQLSQREGLEVKVSESLLKGKPIIIYNAGGMPLQVIDQVNSFVVPVGNTRHVADLLYDLFTNEEQYQRMSDNASKTVQSQFFTISNALNWLFLANELMEKGSVETDMNHIHELIETKFEKPYNQNKKSSV